MGTPLVPPRGCGAPPGGGGGSVGGGDLILGTPPVPTSDASWFNETWLGRIRDDAEDNWRLKVGGVHVGVGHV